jgi:hypothetical protein
MYVFLFATRQSVSLLTRERSPPESPSPLTGGTHGSAVYNGAALPVAVTEEIARSRELDVPRGKVEILEYPAVLNCHKVADTYATRRTLFVKGWVVCIRSQPCRTDGNVIVALNTSRWSK